MFLLLAFIYPPALAQAKENTLNHVLNEHSLNTETLVGDSNRELLLAHRDNRRRYHRRQRNQHYYYQRQRTRRHYRYGSYSGQPYRNGEWELVRDHHGRLMYEWQHY
ncbi:hypothetical protein [Nostoc sp. FACHB-110]|uniref:hypothetical protein n=1 Tax=Nostoc sp. FACHB-110 TaxID=2692834 RepID=UPI001A7E85CC|nr:hypothetical protein [Nostoc sp. FACHB-110]